MGQVYRITNKLNMKSGVPKDAAVNVHHVFTVAGDTVTTAELEIWCTKFAAFYQAIQGMWGSAVQTTANAHSLQVARLTTRNAGSFDDTVSEIYHEKMYTSSYGGASANLPPECAIVLSHRGYIAGVPEEGPGLTRPRSRRRGRIYLGPLNSSAGSSDISGNFTIADATRVTILDAFQALCVALIGDASIPARCGYGVYSPSNDAFYPVEEAHVDNAFDTVRRRGVAASGRTTRAIGLPVESEIIVTDLVGAP